MSSATFETPAILATRTRRQSPTTTITSEMAWVFRRMMFPSCSMIKHMKKSRVLWQTYSTSGSRGQDKRNEDVNSLKTNPYFDKYSEKISELQRSTPEELSRRISTIRKRAFNVHRGKSDNKSLNLTSPFSKKQNLDDIVKLDLLQDKTVQEITDIWLQHYASAKDSVSVVISAKVYELMLHNKSKHPTFLLPLPRQHGYEYFVSQSCGDEFHLTPLINYKTFKENAPECLALTHFIELANDKDIVLMKGEFNDNVLDISEAMCLTNQIHRYYGENDAKRQKILERFSNAPEEFRHMDLIVELERLAS